MNLSVREMKEGDIAMVVDYFVNADIEYLRAMGADKNKLMNKEEWIGMLRKELHLPISKKKFYYMIWEVDGKPSGHSNINEIEYGTIATLHLHLWNNEKRRKGMGLDLLRLTISHYFENFELKKLICQPYALNPAPNRIMKKIGFEFVREYETMPGWINFHQTVRRYEMTKEGFQKLFSNSRESVKRKN